MKKIFNNKLAVFSLLVLTLGCKKTLDINQSPNNPPIESATMEVLFPSAVMSTASRVGGDLSIVGGMWAQFWTQNNNSSQFRTVDVYDLPSASQYVDGPYSALFSGGLFDYSLGLSKAAEAKNWRYNLMYTVMKAYTYEVLVDLYDKVDLHHLVGEDKAHAMGHLGKLESVEDLPGDDVLITYIQNAVILNKEGIKLPKKDAAPKTELLVPDDFIERLVAADAGVNFEKFSTSKRKEYLDWFNEAKTEATRNKRMDTAIEWIAEGKSRNWKYER